MAGNLLMVMRYCAEQRLRRQSDFMRIRRQGRRHECGTFTLWLFRRPDDEQESWAGSRLGVVASKASVGNAVARNRAKRRMRELFRLNQNRIPPGYDLLLVARRAFNGLEYAAIERKFQAACDSLFPTRHE